MKEGPLPLRLDVGCSISFHFINLIIHVDGKYSTQSKTDLSCKGKLQNYIRR